MGILDAASGMSGRKRTTGDDFDMKPGDWTAPNQGTHVVTPPANDTNPDSMGASFSSASSTKFGPGGYSGGYTGAGDTIYWGNLDDSDAPYGYKKNGQPRRHPRAGTNKNLHNPFGPGVVARGVGAAVDKFDVPLPKLDEFGVPHE